MSQKAKILLIQGGPLVNEGTSSSVGLLVIGGVTYSNSSSSSSIGAAAEPIPRTRGLPSEHLHKRSAIESTLASKITFTGGKGCFTQWVNGEFIVITEAIHPHFTQWVNYDYFSNVPINLLTK